MPEYQWDGPIGGFINRTASSQQHRHSQEEPQEDWRHPGPCNKTQRGSNCAQGATGGPLSSWAVKQTHGGVKLSTFVLQCQTIRRSWKRQTNSSVCNSSYLEQWWGILSIQWCRFTYQHRFSSQSTLGQYKVEPNREIKNCPLICFVGRLAGTS